MGAYGASTVAQVLSVCLPPIVNLNDSIGERMKEQQLGRVSQLFLTNRLHLTQG